MPDCSVCKSRGGCPTCAGAGTYQGKPCLICRGQGACPVCGRAFDPAAAPPPVEPPVVAAHIFANPDLRPPEPTSIAGLGPVTAVVIAPGYRPSLERWSNAKLAGRALLAMTVLALFYVFALGVVALLLLVTWLQVQLVNRPGGGYAIGVLIILPPLAALAILLAIWPRLHGWTDPGRGLTDKRAPELFAVLRDVASTAGQPMPRRVYLFDDVNAFVANRGIFMGRALGIGIPLFDMLTVGELRAVIAHELGHYANRGGGLSTFVYRAVRTFGAATEAAGIVPGLNIVFELWADVFLRIAMPISRQQELRADELSCRVAGVETTVWALTKIVTHGPMGEILDPVAGWEQDLHETHPPLRDRIALARALPAFGVPAVADDRPASVLLETLLATASARAREPAPS